MNGTEWLLEAFRAAPEVGRLVSQAEAAPEGSVTSDWLPGLFLIFVIVTGYGLWRRRRRRVESDVTATRRAAPEEGHPERERQRHRGRQVVGSR